MSPSEARLARSTALAILALVALRLVAAAWTPLTFDEAYYWMWSKRLAGGYYDHPPMVALVIRLGTMIAGDTELGVRLVSILLALPMSWAVYRTAASPVRRPARRIDRDHPAQRDADGGGRHHDRHPGCAAAGGVEFRAVLSREGLGQRTRRLVARGRGRDRRRLVVEIHRAVFRPGDPDLAGKRSRVATLADQPMALSGRPRCPGAVAPVIVWNADHQWVSFIKQLGRARFEDFRLGFIGEVIPTQIAFATPLVWMLGATGLYALLRRSGGALAARMLINTTFWTMSGISCAHSLHARVEADWFAPVYPAFAIAAAVAADVVRWEARGQRVVDFCLRWAAPSGVLMFALLVVQANTGALSGYRRDATVRSVGVGWRELAAGIEAVRDRVGAGCVLAPDYGTTGWLAFYLPKGSCVLQQSQRIRWVNMPEPDPSLLSGKLLYVDEDPPRWPPATRGAVRPCRTGCGTAAHARATCHRNLRDRSARRRERRGARPLAAARAGVKPAPPEAQLLSCASILHHPKRPREPVPWNCRPAPASART